MQKALPLFWFFWYAFIQQANKYILLPSLCINMKSKYENFVTLIRLTQKGLELKNKNIGLSMGIVYLYHE